MPGDAVDPFLAHALGELCRLFHRALVCPDYAVAQWLSLFINGQTAHHLTTETDCGDLVRRYLCSGEQLLRRVDDRVPVVCRLLLRPRRLGMNHLIAAKRIRGKTPVLIK